MKTLVKELSFNVGGHLLHTKLWENMTPAGKGGGKPGGALADIIDAGFGRFERFKKEFTMVANSTEGSGWVALVVHQCI